MDNRCDDVLDAIRLWCYNMPLFNPVLVGYVENNNSMEINYILEKKMRFEVVKVENETINTIFGEVYTIKDNADNNSPVSTFRFIKPSADRVCEWLNENIKEIELTPADKINLMVDNLYNPDEIIVENCDGWFFIIEVKDTNVLAKEIADELGISGEKVHIEPIAMNRSIYKISEGCLK